MLAATASLEVLRGLNRNEMVTPKYPLLTAQQQSLHLMRYDAADRGPHGRSSLTRTTRVSSTDDHPNNDLPPSLEIVLCCISEFLGSVS